MTEKQVEENLLSHAWVNTNFPQIVIIISRIIKVMNTHSCFTSKSSNLAN